MILAWLYLSVAFLALLLLLCLVTSCIFGLALLKDLVLPCFYLCLVLLLAVFLAWLYIRVLQLALLFLRCLVTSCVSDLALLTVCVAAVWLSASASESC